MKEKTNRMEVRAKSHRLCTGEKTIQYLSKKQTQIIQALMVITQIRKQNTTTRLAKNSNNNIEHRINRKARAFRMRYLLRELFRDLYAARTINLARTERATTTKQCARARRYTWAICAIVQSNCPERNLAARYCKAGTCLTPAQSSCRSITWAST